MTDHDAAPSPPSAAPTRRHADRVALITGAAGGIGAATAERFALDGAHLVLVDRSEADLDAAAALLAPTGARVLTVVGDITSDASVAAVVDRALEAFSRIDVLVNNAGVSGPVGPILDCDEAGLQAVLDVNVVGTWRMLRAVGAVMVASGRGAIVNISSTVAIEGAPMLGAYAVSKAAVESITRTAAKELAPSGVRVNAVRPGPVDTQLMRTTESVLHAEDPSRIRKAFTRAVPLGRYIAAAEIANAVSFLASDDASGVTGSTYSVDGGSTTT